MGARRRSDEGLGGKRFPGKPVGLVLSLFASLALFAEAAIAVEEEPTAEEARFAPALDGPLRHFEHLDASRTLVEILPLLPGLDEAERSVGHFLAGVALFELGLDPAAERELSGVLDDPQLGGAATVALARVLSRTGRNRDLLALARNAAHETLSAEDRGELAWRAARAAFGERRFRRTARWIEEIPPQSTFAAYGQYLRAQAAFASGQSERAIAVAAGILAGVGRRERTLRDRAAILLGDLYTEAGRYDEAARALGTPAGDSPFAARATRDRLVAEGLASLAAGEFEDATPVVDRVGRYLQRLADEVAASVATPAAVDSRVRELRGSWPPRFAVYARREWAAGHARRALDALAARHGPGGLYGALVRIAGLRPGTSHRHGGDPWLPDREPVARFFYPPQGELDRLLRALALLEEPVAYHGDACRLRAALRIRERVAHWLLDDASPPGREELHGLASFCGDGRSSTDDLARATRARLEDVLRAEAAAVRDRFRRDRLELELAIGRAWARYLAELEQSRREALAHEGASPLGRP